MGGKKSRDLVSQNVSRGNVTALSVSMDSSSDVSESDQDNKLNSEQTQTMGRKKKSTNISTFATNLSLLLKEHNLSLRDAGAVAGVSKSTIADWCSGVDPCGNYVAILKLAQRLGVSLTFLLTGIREKPSMDDVFEMGDYLYEGPVVIQIRKLVPRKKDEG